MVQRDSDTPCAVICPSPARPGNTIPFSTDARHSVDVSWCGCVVVCLCCCVAAWLCGCVAAGLCGRAFVWLCGCVVVWLCGHVAVSMRGCGIVWLFCLFCCVAVCLCCCVAMWVCGSVVVRASFCAYGWHVCSWLCRSPCVSKSRSCRVVCVLARSPSHWPPSWATSRKTSGRQNHTYRARGVTRHDPIQ